MNYTPYQIRQFVIEAELQALAAAQREGDTARYECRKYYKVLTAQGPQDTGKGFKIPHTKFANNRLNAANTDNDLLRLDTA